MAGKVLGVKCGVHLEILRAANEVFGGSFLSRFNMNLRETKGRSSGVYSQVSGDKERLAWVAVAQDQAERTGDSVKEVRSELTAFLKAKGMAPAALERTINRNVSTLPGRFETAENIPGGIWS